MGRFAKSFREGLTPPPRLSVSDWADQYRKLSPKGSSEPGSWRTSRTPYLKEIMDVCGTDNPTTDIVIQKSSQVGASEAIMNVVGHTIHLYPCPILAVWPIEGLTKKMVKTRFDPMISGSKVIKSLFSAQPKDQNTVFQKDFVGGNITFASGNSPNSLSSVSGRLLIMDELDRFPMDVKSEGDPVALAEERTSAFSRPKRIKFSTPTVDGGSLIAEAFEQSDRRYYHVPCPHCEELFVMSMDNFRYKETEGAVSDYWFDCPACNKKILEHHKRTMLPGGRWIPTKESPVAGFHLNQFVMPLGWKSWKRIAEQHVAASKQERRMIVFYNTVLGIPWARKVDRPDYERLLERREHYTIGRVPKGVVFITTGVDVQRDRFEIHVVGWHRDRSFSVIDYQVLFCDTAEDSSWDSLAEELFKTFESVDGKTVYPSQRIGVDTGFRTTLAYGFISKHSASGRVLAVKGKQSLAVPIGRPSFPHTQKKGRIDRQGVLLYPVGTDVLKGELYDRLALNRDPDTGAYPPRYGHFPELDADYFRMLTAESRETKIERGVPKERWVKVHERNEALDTWVYARAVASEFGLEQFSDREWDLLSDKLESLDVSNPVANQEIIDGKQRVKVKRKESSFW